MFCEGWDKSVPTFLLCGGISLMQRLIELFAS
ncbi:hypothetical protein SMU63_06505 [Streptococcus mutans T4]|nr:hypothetical protein SMU63_06505 [Streptococcus mutans T4]EMC17154.1 hypothetical protein SMU77_05965 [Streptococcus mutans NV1996]